MANSTCFTNIAHAAYTACQHCFCDYMDMRPKSACVACLHREPCEDSEQMRGMFCGDVIIELRR